MTFSIFILQKGHWTGKIYLPIHFRKEVNRKPFAITRFADYLAGKTNNCPETIGQIPNLSPVPF